MQTFKTPQNEYRQKPGIINATDFCAQESTALQKAALGFKE